jgi:hypothetical protein
LEELIKTDLEEFRKKEEEKAAVVTTSEENEDGSVTTTTTTTTTKVEKVVIKKAASAKTHTKADDKLRATAVTTSTPIEQSTGGTTTPATTNSSENQLESTSGSHRTRFAQNKSPHAPRGENHGDPPDTSAQPKGKVSLPQESNDKVVIGLRVYTHKDVTCSVEGKLKTGCKDPNCKDCAPPITVTIPAVKTETTATTILTAA